jgi:DNA-binding XRE family transcriptional regulator
MARDSSAPRLQCAAPLELPEEARAKPLRRLKESVATESEARRKAASNSNAAKALRLLRTETGLTQVDTAALTGDVSSRTVGSYERGDVDLGALRVFVALLEFRARQRGER